MQQENLAILFSGKTPLTVLIYPLSKSPFFCMFFSSTNVPAGSSEAAKAFTNQTKSFCKMLFTAKARARKATNKTPCAHPTTVTIFGKPARYFSGMAISRRTRKEMPSAMAILRNQERVLFFVFMFVAHFRRRAMGMQPVKRRKLPDEHHSSFFKDGIVEPGVAF